MFLTKEMIDEAKKYAWQNEDHYIHTASNGSEIKDYPGFYYEQKYIINPWSQISENFLKDPFLMYGEDNMETFIIQVLANRDITLLQNKDALSGWLYIGDDGEGKERFALGEIGIKNMICFGINPSKAKPEDDDQTIRTVRKIASKYKCDGWIMLNMYPIRWTDPNKLPEQANTCAMKKNEYIVKAILELYQDAPIWAAWGSNIDKQKYLSNLLLDNVELFKNRTWICRGRISKKGHPHHPLYVGNKEEFMMFDIKKYICEVLK